MMTSWEAVEHAGPGEYDTAYLDYFAELCRLAGEYGFYLFVDFHQDAWSRMSGGGTARAQRGAEGRKGAAGEGKNEGWLEGSRSLPS